MPRDWMRFATGSTNLGLISSWVDGRRSERRLSENVHPDDFTRYLETYLTAFHARKPFTMVYRLKRRDDVYREFLDNGAAFYRNGTLPAISVAASIFPIAARWRRNSARLRRWKRSVNLRGAWYT